MQPTKETDTKIKKKEKRKVAMPPIEKSALKKIAAKPLPVDKEKAKEIEQSLEEKVAEKKEEAPEKKEKIIIEKKEEAVARGSSLPISKKHSMFICKFIKNKSIDSAISDLGQVQKMKMAIPYKGEIPHRKNLGQGRYPVKASGYFINLLKSLKGNIVVNGMDLYNSRIVLASACWASRPLRSGGRAAKRTNILLKAKEVYGGKR
ncbi:hypothetical protein J4462_02095 [Candidatus Pacearchaeota archaeon]|nr:hypothetical protein [Candidatus Pacearchaeota archaeon]